ncbi:hypothetical protein B0I35DRAFT_474242 [Stachybotrys elegans]|uniref:Rhodopsin domain-containing protein n=1 Tax=Stachybotrys elegans TaxID=80388 RepID=A0A8K0WYM3_9HYPO|nr:hypothetical protein B0I35DRAFT_474242 [Stachybotrys elegans]
MSLDNFHFLSPRQQDDVLNSPALKAPEGITSNIENPPNHNDLGHALLIVYMILVIASALMRGSARLLTPELIKLQDYIALAALAFFGTYMWLNFWFMDVCGFFVHQWDITLRQFFDVLRIVFLASNMYDCTMLSLRVAILLEWVTIFSPPGSQRRWLYLTCMSVMGFNILYFICSTTAHNFECIPYERIWNRTIPGACADFRPEYVVTSSINLVTDLVIFLVPQRTIWGLQMSLKKKLGLAFVFFVGMLGCACAAIRFVQSTIYSGTDDTAYSITGITLTNTAEMTCGFLVFCVPSSVKLLWRKGVTTRIMGSLRPWISGSRTKQTDHSEGSRASKPTTNSSNRFHRLKEDDFNIGMTNISPQVDGGIPTDTPAAKYGSGILMTSEFTAVENYHNGSESSILPSNTNRFKKDLESNVR